MKRILALITVVVMSLAASGALLAQNNPFVGDNPFVGRWELNLAKSKFTGTPAPKSETRTVVAQINGQTIGYKGIAADGTPIAYSITTNLDGKDAPYSGEGPLGADAAAIKLVNSNPTTAILKKAGQTVGKARVVVSKDGKVTTVMLNGTNAQGRLVSSTTVWDKQPNDTSSTKGGGDIVDPPHWKQPKTP